MRPLCGGLSFGFAETLSFGVLHIVPPSGSIPFQSVFRAALLPAARPCFARITCARVRARGRAYRGGAVRARDCPREAEGAPRPSVPAGVFFAAPSHASAQKRKRAAPETALPSTPILAHFANSQAPKQTKSEFLQNRGRNLRHPFLPGFGYRQKQGLWAGPTGFTHLSLVASQRTPQPSPRPPSRGPASILAAAPDRGPG